MRLNEKQIHTLLLSSYLSAVLGLVLGTVFSSQIAARMGWGYHPTITVDTAEKVVVPLTDANKN